MKYEVGDEIVVLHTKEEGRVVEIINDKMVVVEVRGVKFPAYTDQLDFPYFKRFTEKKPVFQEKKEKKYVDNLPKEKSKPAEIKATTGIWLSLLPKFTLDDFGDEVVELFKIHLVNRTDTGYKFTYRQQFFGNDAFDIANEITAFHDFYLHDISFADFNDSPSFVFDFSLITPDKKKAVAYESITKIKPKQLFQRVEEMKQKNEPTISYKLFETYPLKTEEDKPELPPHIAGQYALYEAKKARQHLEAPRSVIDLHIEKLIDDFKDMSSFEILTLQLKEFEKWYGLSIAHHQPNLVVIHGVGSGKLRDEIHDLIKTRKEVSYFVNQYHPRYGYGATEIFFQY